MIVGTCVRLRSSTASDPVGVIRRQRRLLGTPVVLVEYRFAGAPKEHREYRLSEVYECEDIRNDIDTKRPSVEDFSDPFE